YSGWCCPSRLCPGRTPLPRPATSLITKAPLFSFSSSERIRPVAWMSTRLECEVQGIRVVRELYPAAGLLRWSESKRDFRNSSSPSGHPGPDHAYVGSCTFRPMRLLADAGL